MSLNVVFGIRCLVNAVSEGVRDVHLVAGTVDDVAKVPEHRATSCEKVSTSVALGNSCRRDNEFFYKISRHISQLYKEKCFRREGVFLSKKL